MVLFAVVAALAVLGTVQGAATGARGLAYGYEKPPHDFSRDSVHLQPSECPPVAAAVDFTHTEVVHVQDFVTKTSLEYWPVDLMVTTYVFKTSTEYLPNLVTVTPLPPRETVYVSITTPVAKRVDKHYVSNVVSTALAESIVQYVQYVTPSVVTKFLPVTRTNTHTILSSFSTTATRHMIVTKTEYAVETTTTHVYDTVTDYSTVYRTHINTQVVKAPIYETVTFVGATATVPVFVTASCVPSKGKGKGAGLSSHPSVHEKMLEMKEHMRDKFASAYEDGLAAFDFHIAKLKRKLDQSKTLSTSKVSTSYADEPALRKVKNIHPLDVIRDKGSLGSGLLGAGKATNPYPAATVGKGAGVSDWVTVLLNKGNGGGLKAGAGLGSAAPLAAKGTPSFGTAKGETSSLDGGLGDLKALALPLLQSYKASAVEPLGQGKAAAY